MNSTTLVHDMHEKHLRPGRGMYQPTEKHLRHIGKVWVVWCEMICPGVWFYFNIHGDTTCDLCAYTRLYDLFATTCDRYGVRRCSHSSSILSA